MMGTRQEAQSALFYEFSVEAHVPADHMLRAVDRFVDLGGIRQHLAPFYSSTGRPSVDPELTIRMLLIGYIMGIRSERRLCEEVHLNLAYRWFCRLDLTDPVPDHSKNRHGRFRDSDLLRHLFETVVASCIAEGLASGQRGIVPHIPVFDKSARRDGTFERTDFTYDAEQDTYTCPGGKELKQNRRAFTTAREQKPDEHGMLRYRASKADCDVCELKARCCPKAPARKVLRSIYEPSRNRARAIA
jgi:transposase